MMVAQVSGMNAGRLVHMIADAHIYDRHVDIVRELISRPTHPAPKVTLNPEVTDFYDFTTSDLMIEGYEHGPQVTNIPIAV
jgi:thymidylate synthase